MTEPNAEDRELEAAIDSWLVPRFYLTNLQRGELIKILAQHRTRIKAKHMAALRKAQNALIDIRDVACGEPQCKTAARTCLAVLKELGV